MNRLLRRRLLAHVLGELVADWNVLDDGFYVAKAGAQQSIRLCAPLLGRAKLCQLLARELPRFFCDGLLCVLLGCGRCEHVVRVCVVLMRADQGSEAAVHLMLLSLFSVKLVAVVGGKGAIDDDGEGGVCSRLISRGVHDDDGIMSST